jgi:hypothetical protein
MPNWKKWTMEVMSPLGGVITPMFVLLSVVTDLSAAGITAALSAIALGFGMIPGIFVLLTLGAGTTSLLRWTLRRAFRLNTVS